MNQFENHSLWPKRVRMVCERPCWKIHRNETIIKMLRLTHYPCTLSNERQSLQKLLLFIRTWSTVLKILFSVASLSNILIVIIILIVTGGSGPTIGGDKGFVAASFGSKNLAATNVCSRQQVTLVMRRKLRLMTIITIMMITTIMRQWWWH